MNATKSLPDPLSFHQTSRAFLCVLTAWGALAGSPASAQAVAPQNEPAAMTHNEDEDDDDGEMAAMQTVQGHAAPMHTARRHRHRGGCPSGPFDAPLPPGARATAVPLARPSDTFNETLTATGNVEGPVWNGRALFFSEFNFVTNPPPSRIIRLIPGHPGTVAVEDAGTNGLALGPSGDLFGGSHKVGGIVRINPRTGQQRVIIDQFDGKRFNSPNDLALRRDGTIYFTDPDYQAPSPLPQLKTRVYRVAPGAKQAQVVDENRPQPNGITLSPDEKTLYVAAADGIFKYAVAPNGSTGTPQRFTNAVASSDGMVVDCAGNLYLTQNDVVVLSPDGLEIGRIPAPSPDASVTNVAFGGQDRKTLFITALGGSGRGLYQVRLQVPGYPY